MPRNGSGTMAVVNTLVSGTTITASGHNQNYVDIAAEITNSVAVDGQSTMTGQLKSSSGTVSLPGISFGSDLDCGLYRIGANNIGLALNGAKVVDFLTTGVAITGTFSASGAATFSAAVTIASGGLTVTAGGLTVTAGGLTVTLGGLTVSAGGAAITGNSTVTGTLAVTDVPTFSSTSHMVAPIGTTAQRPSPAAGQTRYNSTTSALETYNGTAWAAPGVLPTRQTFLSGTAATYTTPAGCRQLRIRMVGGGGGGAAINTNEASDGGSTSFNSIVAAGGSKGTRANGTPNGNGGNGGTGGTGSATLRLAGGGGACGTTSNGTGGNGGSSAFGGNGIGGTVNSSAGQAGAANTGGGGGGAGIAGGVGAGGGGAGEYVELIINSPSATYTYTVGAGGAGGAAGGVAGAAGGSGIIIVDECY